MRFVERSKASQVPQGQYAAYERRGVWSLNRQYLESLIRLRAEQLAGEMGELMSFVAQTFWLGPARHITFRPDPIDPDVCDAERKQLDEKLGKAWDACKAYRRL